MATTLHSIVDLSRYFNDISVTRHRQPSFPDTPDGHTGQTHRTAAPRGSTWRTHSADAPAGHTATDAGPGVPATGPTVEPCGSESSTPSPTGPSPATRPECCSWTPFPTTPGCRTSHARSTTPRPPSRTPSRRAAGPTGRCAG